MPKSWATVPTATAATLPGRKKPLCSAAWRWLWKTQALKDAQLAPSQIGYVNGHGTATEQGDIAETQATEALFGSRMPISSQKSYLGHTLGACGALESWFSIEMMNSGWFAPTLNLDHIDPRCGRLDYIRGQGREIDTDYVMNNNFAFGGVNTSLVFKRWRGE